MLMTSVTKVVNVRRFLYGAALAGVNTTATPVRMVGLNGSRREGGRPGPRCCRGSRAGPPPLALHGPSRLHRSSRFPWHTVLPVQGTASARGHAGGLCRGHAGSGGTAAAGCAGAPRRARGGLAAPQRIRQRHSLCRRCPPLFSPRARGDAPALPRLPESTAVLARGSPASLTPPVTPGLPPCLAAAVLLPAIWAASQPGLDGWMDGRLFLGMCRRSAGGRHRSCRLIAGGHREGDEKHSRGPGNPAAEAAPLDLAITGHHHGSWMGMAVPWPARG